MVRHCRVRWHQIKRRQVIPADVLVALATSGKEGDAGKNTDQCHAFHFTARFNNLLVVEWSGYMPKVAIQWQLSANLKQSARYRMALELFGFASWVSNKVFKNNML